MSYNARWYRDYAVEMQRDAIREVHDPIFRIYKLLHRELFLKPLETIDLGCATCEFGVYVRGIMNYAGLDITSLPKLCETERFSIFQADMRSAWPDVGFKPNSFVSLFASELIMSSEERENFYTRLFHDKPSIKTALVSGFYYTGHESEEKYTETDNTGRTFSVYQTIQEPVYNKLFTEIRIKCYPRYLMFPAGCVEVWRILIRR